MSHSSTIARELADYLGERFSLTEEIQIDTDLVSAGLLESLTIMDLLAHIEQAYDVVFEPQEIRPANFRSAARLAELIDAKQIQLTSA